MDSKIRIKIGQVEVEFEGSEEFLKSDLFALLDKVVDLQQKHLPIPPEPDETQAKNARNPSLGNLGITSVASKLKIKTGKDLVVAACAYFTIVRGEHEFSRTQMLDEMQNAKNYYQKNYSKNLSRYLHQLLEENVINETASKKYALTASSKQKLEKDLAN